MADKQFLYNDDLTFIGDMNCCPRKSDIIKSFCDIYDLKNLVVSPNCHKDNNPTLLDVILVSKPRRFAKSLNYECILSDFIILLELQPKSICLWPNREELSIEVTRISMTMLSLGMWPLHPFMSREYLMMCTTHRFCPLYEQRTLKGSLWKKYGEK